MSAYNFRLAQQLTLACAFLAAAPVGHAQNSANTETPQSTVRIVQTGKTSAAARPVEVNYIVAPGDTLIGIARQLLRPDLDWRYLRAVNGLTDERQLVPGQRLRIPSNWLKDNPVQMTISSFSGKVDINGEPANSSSTLTESDTIETGQDGTVLVTLPDGTEMQIAPSSQVRIDRLRKYFGNDAVDARLRLEKGGVDTRVTPKEDFGADRPGTVVPDIRTSPSGSANPSHRFLIQTPKATATVRGTEFRVIESPELSSSAVLSGDVLWSAGANRVDVAKGFGSTADRSGQVTKPEKLLPAPVINPDPAPLTNIIGRVEFTPVAGATSYRVRIAADAGFTQNVTEQIVAQPSAIIRSERDGVHHLAVRGISQTGVEGIDGKAQVRFAARPIAPNPSGPQSKSTQFSNKTSLSWLQPMDVERYRLQIAGDAEFTKPLVDEQLTTLSYDYESGADEPAPRHRWWRIASLDATGQGPWSDVLSFTQRDPGPAPTATASSNGVVVTWPEIADASYVVLVKPLTPSGSPAREIETDAARVTFNDLGPGRYEIRTIAVFEGGLRSPPGDPQVFTIELLWRDGFGNTVLGSGEEMKGLQPE